MTFNNKSLNSWLALLFSIFRAGFHLDEGKIVFQDGVSHYKETTHTRTKGSPFGDFIYQFSKRKQYETNSSFTKENLAEFINLKLDYSTIQHTKGENRNKILIEFFESIIPKLELFVNSEHFEECHEIYKIFTKKQLHFLYD